jgi:hypothetical protein
MADKNFPQSGLPIRKTVELLPSVFRTETNDKFMSAVVDPLVQPGVLQKTVGYVGRRYGKTYLGKDNYLDNDGTLRSRYQLEPGVILKDTNGKIDKYYDYIDFKNQLKFFGNFIERDDLLTAQEHHSWNPPKQCDKFVNYREYYWIPEGPPAVAVYGQKAKVVSEYSVKLGLNSFIFSPDSYTNNPTITLYRGQKYRFKVNAPNEGFAIRHTYDTGSLIYNPNKPYAKGQYAIYNNKLWMANKAMVALENSTIDLDTQDWTFVEDVTTGTAFDYVKGVTNNGIENGYLTFEVPYDAPDTLFYQGVITPDRFGRFVITNIESNTKIDIEKDIIGKAQYTSSNGIKFTSGLVVEFRGEVTPKKYATGSWVVESVGNAISLTNFQDLVVPTLTSNLAPEIFFDNEGFDTQPFDDASAYPAELDYVVIARDSIDSNPWSRYNRWFHREVLEFAYASRGEEFSAPETSRAKRPIIEFLPSLQLFNHGAVAKATVDYIDDYTDDVFSKIEGSTGYNVDGEDLFAGARVLIVADTDRLANNKIYEVQFITHNGRRQLHLEPTADTESIVGQGVLIRRGANNQGRMYHFDGTVWKRSQAKTGVNQSPKFDVFDDEGVSFGDAEKYPVSTFDGCNIVSYKVGNGVVDSQLGFPLSYLNINNVGDIQFNFEWDNDVFYYLIDRREYSKNVATGYYRFNPNNEYGNCWVKTTQTYIQPIIDSVIVDTITDSIYFTTIDWTQISSNKDFIIKFYINGVPYTGTWTRYNNVIVFDQQFAVNDVISVKIVADIEPNTGYYQIPVGLEKNPLNDPITSWTLGQAVDHLAAAMEFNSDYTGILPGLSNLRDIPINEFGLPYNTLGTRYMTHSGIASMAVTLLCDKQHNIIKSLQYAKKSYTNFKNNFLEKAVTIEYNDNIADFVDDIIAEITKTKTSESPFADSDMLGSGAYTTITYTVEDTGIKTFALSEKFSLTELSRRAVYVYIDGVQLLNTKDYEFNSTFGFVTINKILVEGSLIEIREYISTASSFVPPTPTSMGLYKKYTPMKFIDDTYREPKEVIQGHDGSITIAYGDFRDELLMELEYRIYNNIKQEYNAAVFDLDNMVAGYNAQGVYTKAELDSVVIPEFLKWTQGTTINYTLNEYFIENESFTYTYSNMTDPTGTQNLPGYWRGVYQWFYDTDRPHRCPWEMLGFTEQPTWWEDEYGAAPYTSNNLILWEDLRDGIIRQGTRAGRYDRYARPTLMSHIPVDGDGKLLSPLDSNLANNFTLINNKGPFVLGDVSPAEYAWRSSSEWPFAMMIAMSLLRPFEFITDSFDRSRTKLNILGQTVNSTTNRFVRLEDIVIPTVGGDLAVGLVKYLVDYIKSTGTPVSTISDKLKNIDVQLSTRLSGFVDKEQQKYLLDSKSPSSASSGIFVPQEDYQIIFNVSSPLAAATYSGVILEKVEGGWVATGYDDISPFFSYYPAATNQSDPLMSVGGVSENFVDWTSGKTYNNGQLARYQDKYFRALKTHVASTTFDTTAWKQLAKLPLVGSVDAFRRSSFNTISVKKLSYGTKFTTVQSVVDFLLGYEAYLQSIGFAFNEYDHETQTAKNWTTSCKEFMFWTKHNWAIGSLITISPAAEKLDITLSAGVADNLLDGFYDYQILKGDGKPLSPQYINVNRTFQNVTVSITDTTEGIYFLKAYYVLKEHVTVFNDRTVFNDILYDKPTGYRQERIKAQGFRTVDWDGDYTSPGFLFDNVNIDVWQPFTDYRLGDIVAYRSYNWTSLYNQLGSEEFNTSNWSRLDSTPEKRLVANFDYRINQMEDYYDVMSAGIGEAETELARHAVGYQTRAYLENLAEDPVTQFQLYQGFIREKGTNNALTKVFDKLSRSTETSLELNEEWAFRVGRFGGIDQLTEVEMLLSKNNFQVNPQPILITSGIDNAVVDQNYRVPQSDFTIAPTPFDLAINPTITNSSQLKTAGYVNTDQPEIVVASRDDILALNISAFSENDHVWVTFDSYTWTVLRYNESPALKIYAVRRPTTTTVEVEFLMPHSIAVGDIVGIKNVLNLIGFFKVTAIDKRVITVAVDSAIQDPELVETVTTSINLFTVARISSYSNLDVREASLLKTGSKLWIDNNGSNLWEVVQKQTAFSVKELLETGTTSGTTLGKKVIYSEKLGQTIAGMPAEGLAMAYTDSTAGLTLKQVIAPPAGLEPNVAGSFGAKLALSPDSRFLVVTSPLASGVRSQFKGEYSPLSIYTADDIVLYDGKLWKALNVVYAASGDSTWIDVYSEDWEPATSIAAITDVTKGSAGFTEQGMITIYEYSNQQWELRNSFVSPRPATFEYFGSEVTLGQSGNTYYMAVSATGSLDNRGRVYLYTGTPSAADSSVYEWKHLENTNYTTFYKGVYDSTLNVEYPAGSVVWYDGKLWQAQVDVVNDGSTVIGEQFTPFASGDWKEIDPISTQCSLPQNIALNDDGSTLSMGLLSPTQLAELVKQGDQFGTSMTMSRDGSILAIGTPNSDGQYFANYRGIWRSDISYAEGDVVKFANAGADLSEDASYSYYKLIDPRSHDEDYDSTIGYFSLNELPENGDPWVVVGDSTSTPSGKVYVYQRSTAGTYELQQTITSDSLSDLSDITGEVISSGDQFGFAIDMDYSGTTLVISSPRADLNYQNQGSVYVFRTDGYAPVEYRLKQKIESYETYANEFFGWSVSISSGTEKIVVGAKNSTFITPTSFSDGTTFDQGKTRFYDNRGYAGAAYVFERKVDSYFLAEKLEAKFSPFESFGYSIDCTDSVVVVGSPDYIAPVLVNAAFTYPGEKTGTVRLFRKDTNVNPWNVLARQEPTVDLTKIKSIALYDNVNNFKIQDIDYVDHAKLKILNVAEQELKFKTPYDPAVYSVGTENQVVEPGQSWAEKHVGELWWDISTAKWLDYEQDDLSYRIGNWNVLAPGASIDVYEWVGSALLPSEWAALADTTEGFAAGISGQPLYPNDDVLSAKVLFNPTTGVSTDTIYYYWVKGKRTIPTNMPSRRISSASVVTLIENPSGTGITFVSLIAADKFLAYNFTSVMSADTALLNIQYAKNDKELNPIHNEYQLLTADVADSLPTGKLEAKWIDSLIGQDPAGNSVPDVKLAAKQKYGLSFRPRQTMFVNRLSILKTVITNINTVLQKEAFADIVNYDNFNLVDAAPESVLNLYDTTVDTEADLAAVGTVRVKTAILQANIVNGEIDTIDVINPGFGYKVVPPLTITGDGTGAEAQAIIDNQGRVVSVTVTARGKRYVTANATVRNFSVLVLNDSTINNFWSIYAWDETRKIFFRTQSQSYDTTRYWTLINWWKAGYSSTSRIVKEIMSVSDSATLSISVGDLIRVKEYANGGWAVFECVDTTKDLFSDNYTLVGRENGTIEISDAFYTDPIGYDNSRTYDITSYDIENAKELRNIFAAIKQDVFVGDYAVEWNKLFFASIRYVFSEQQYVDWAFKTSFLNATHNVGSLEQKLNYRNDNLVDFQSYIDEVKPYRTTVREYVSRYDTTENSGLAISDFDLPATYSISAGQVIPITSSSTQATTYPWKWWTDNNGYSIVAIEVYDAGSNYSAIPTVLIEGNGTGATAQAYISNGKISGIQVLTAGSGYTRAPTVTIVGGNSSGASVAKATAILGDTKARTFDVSIKFDRLAKTGTYQNFTQTETLTATGLSAVFDLKYAPTSDKSKITVYKNSQLVLQSEYTISLYKSSVDTYKLIKGKVTFITLPEAGDVISITYEKNDELLDAVNRIKKYYSPTSGMKGYDAEANDLSQLMTGIDFGGVQIQGTTFDVTGGWDALPWFTDNWDSVESSADHYVLCDGSTIEITLPFVPAVGQQITVYLKRAGLNQPTIRIDDPFFNAVDDSSTSANPNAQMPTFVGNGTANIVAIGPYVSTEAGDTLIFRPIDSDGSVTITDDNLLDTKLGGGDFSSNTTNVGVAPNAINGAYSTANGLSAADIGIDGASFISPDQVPAPEENVPGQVLDSLSIKVFNNTLSGATPLQSKTLISNGTTRLYDIDLEILESKSIMVYVDKTKQVLGTNYEINFVENQIQFATAPVSGAIIEMIAIGIGGISLIDYQEFIADGTTKLFLTSANFADTADIYVTVNGEYRSAGFVDSTGIVDTEGKTLVEFGINPAYRDVVKIICIGTDSRINVNQIPVVRVNKQRLEFEGSTRSFELTDFVNLNRASTMSSVVVEANGTILQGVDTIYAEYDGVQNTFVLGIDPEETAGAILTSNIKVYVNGDLKTFIQDYVYDGIDKILTIESTLLTVGDIIKIENDLRAEYSIVDNVLTIADSVSLASTNERDNDYIDVTWFSEYPTLELTSDEYVGGKVNYVLPQTPLGAGYVWVYKNGTRLTKDQDYSVSLPRSVLYLTEVTTPNDIIKVITFGTSVYKLPSAFEIHKDMLNVYRFNRFAIDNVKLTSDLSYYDTIISVSDADTLSTPIANRNIPGIIYINGERIEYMIKAPAYDPTRQYVRGEYVIYDSKMWRAKVNISEVDGSTINVYSEDWQFVQDVPTTATHVLTQLRRGVQGTAIAELHSTGSSVSNVSSTETIPYKETQDRVDFVSDGTPDDSTLGAAQTIGPLTFVPVLSTRNNWVRNTIPTTFGPCDTIEVFVAGRRLRKDPISVYDETRGASSPSADKVLEAEFSVDGTSNTIRLTETVPAGLRVTVIRKVGNVWYEKGTSTASNGISLLDSGTAIADFIAKRTTDLPE